MPSYTFETITPEQAAAFGASDSLSFTSQFAGWDNRIIRPHHKPLVKFPCWLTEGN